jgi:hypothetical protein
MISPGYGCLRRKVDELVDEVLVDLQIVNIQLPGTEQGRIAGAEIVHGHGYAPFLQLAKLMVYQVEVARKEGFGDFQADPGGSGLLLFEKSEEIVEECVPHQLDGGHVDGHVDVVIARPAEFFEKIAGQPRDLPSQGNNELEFLRQGDEFQGRNEAEPGALHAGQGFKSP